MKLLLIDGNSVLFRAYYATAYGQMLKTTDGIYTNAVFAFANMLNKALKEIAPDYCAVAFDKGKHTFRHDLCPDYKGGRRETPPELIPQFAMVREMMTAWGIPYFEYDHIEADDIIGTLAKRYQVETCILSSDRDLLQLIDDTTSVYVMKKGITDIAKMDEKALMADYELKPYQIIDYKGLAGDKSDNIPGVPGIGDKTAVKLLNLYDTCEGIYEHLDEVKGKMKEKLENGKESCLLSKMLATIKTDVDIDIELDDLKFTATYDALNEFFEKYQMRSLIRKDHSTKKVIAPARKVSKISKDLLTDGTFINFISNEFSYFDRDFYGAAISSGDMIEYIDKNDLLKDDDLLEFIAGSTRKCVYDLKALLHMADHTGFKIGENTDDVMLMAYLSNNNNDDLHKIVHAYGTYLSIDRKDLFGSVKKPNDPDSIELLSYAYELTQGLSKAYRLVSNELKDKEMTALYENLELPLTRVLYSMEKEGICCDRNELDEIAQRTYDIMNGLEKDIYHMCGHEFNINSPAQLSEVLYGELDLPDLKKGSTNAETLNKLYDYHPVIARILDYRKYSKLYSTYAEGLKKYISADDKIHTIFSQTVTATGRLSSLNPNLQNISVRDDESREIRKAFKPSSDSVLMSSDYSQIELRVLASLSGEKEMIEAFNEGIDIHSLTAMKVFHLNADEVTPNIRRQAKAVNFGVVYGISDFGLANQTSMSFSSAKRFIDDYFKTYPAIKEYLDGQIEYCKENGYVKTILNRRRYISEINDSKWQMREFGKRAAMNSTIQGSAADLIKIAMVRVYNRIKELGLRSKLILQVHDELIFDVPKDEIDTMKALIFDCMSNVYDLKVKLESSMAIGNDWYEAK